LSISSPTDQAIASGKIDLTGLSQAHGWTAKRYLYAKLQQNPDLQDDYPEFASFLSSEINTSVGQLHAVQQKLSEGLQVSSQLQSLLDQINTDENLALKAIKQADQILENSQDQSALASAQHDKESALVELSLIDSRFAQAYTEYQATQTTALQDAMDSNNIVIAVSDFEQHEKTVNNIAILQVLSQGGELSETQIDVLRSIASKCPKIDGHGVYRARGLLTGCNAENWSDNSEDCYPEASQAQEQVLEIGFQPRSEKRPLASEFLVYPNPADKSVFVRTVPAQDGQITLQDVTGKVWSQVSFTSNDTTKQIDLTQVPSGHTTGHFGITQVF
jgi:Secretion system C-terminal sorting domain